MKADGTYSHHVVLKASVITQSILTQAYVLYHSSLQLKDLRDVYSGL